MNRTQDPAHHTTAPALRLALVGGRLEADNKPIFAALRERCGGRLAVLATASLMPYQVGPETAADMQVHGIEAEFVDLTFENRAAAAFDPAVLGRLNDLGAVYFTGGDQSHLLGTLTQGGVETPALAAIRAIVARGGLAAGSSAGTAIMSRRAILGGTSLEAAVHGVATDPGLPGLLIGPGLGLFPYGIVDQHFIQRGRIGRLLVAMAATGERFGFGVDENTALFADGTVLSVIGEKGVVVLDAREATFDVARRHYDGFRVSYLDDGDAWDAAAHQAIPGPKRNPIRRSRAFRGPGYVQRSVFGPNAFDELLTRLAEGDAERYAHDSGSAYDPEAETEIVLELERAVERSRSLAARRGRRKRYTVLDYGLAMRGRALPVAAHKEWAARHTKQLMRGRAVAPAARLIAIGAALDGAAPELFAQLRALDAPIVVIAAAAAESDSVAREYVELLRAHGIAASAFDPANEDALQQLAAAPAILFTGGNQERLLQALFHLGEESALLEAVLAAYKAGGVLIAIGGSANALSPAMISGGTSEEALLFGASPDPWYRGVVLQEGLGIFRDGLIDQHFVGRNRLGRLLVACVEEGMRYGFGLAEDGALIRAGGGHRIAAFGGHGYACLDLTGAVIDAHAHGFAAQRVELHWVAPGQTLDTATGRISGAAGAASGLDEIVQRFASEAEALEAVDQPVCRITSLAVGANQARFDIEVRRPPEGRRSIPEIDSRARPHRD
jgi:cyanophycinase